MAEYLIVLNFYIFEIRYCFGFRYSDFEIILCHKKREFHN